MNYLLKLKPAVFIIILILFFLPFAEIKCNSSSIAELKGIEFVTGREIKYSLEDDAETKKIDSDPYAIAAFIASLLCLLFSFFSGKILFFLNGLLSLAGMVFLLLFKNNLDSSLSRSEKALGLLKIEYKFAFWMSFTIFMLYGIISLSVSSFKKK